jgi:uncharacterized protein (DUF305 family)
MPATRIASRSYAGALPWSWLGRAADWRAAALLGLISSSYSTLLSQLTAALLGRDASVDWMSVAAIPARDWVISSEPTASAVAIGIAFHQWADFSWALVFFGVFARWTGALSTGRLAIVAPVWGLLTSALEWFVLVPLFPFFQPIFPLQQPYWIGFLVHVSSALIYPLFPWLRRRLNGSERRLAMCWSAAMAGLLLLIALAALGSARGHVIGWHGSDLGEDQTFMRHMRTHHEQGITLAALAAERAVDPHLRRLAKLMLASQRGETAFLERWWTAWFEVPLEVCSAREREAMPGLLKDDEIRQLRSTPDAAFDARFVAAMTEHHKGAVAMADRQWHAHGDIRLTLMAHAIRHEQQGEIALMHGVDGIDAVRRAFANMFADNINGGEAWR